MGPLLSYYLPALWGEAWLVRDDPARYGVVMNQASALEPTYYLTLAKYYVDHKMEPEAAAAYQSAIDRDADPVGVANSTTLTTRWSPRRRRLTSPPSTGTRTRWEWRTIVLVGELLL